MVRSRMMLALVAAAFASMAPAWAATPFDGTYKGSATLSASRGGKCDQTLAFSLPVREGKFNWRLPGAGAMEVVTLKPDGSFSAQNGKRFLSGKAGDGKLTAHTVGDYCEYDWALVR